jgi:epsilon-lactone hydrolase
MTTATHALSGKDEAAVGQMREGLKGVKGTVTGPHARPMFDEIMKGVAPADGIESDEGSVGGVPGIWVRPRSGPGDRAILYLHGGAYVVGSPRAYVNFVGQVVSRSGIPAFVADYALAPERPFPAAIEDALRAYNGLVEQGIRQTALAGDSAGGGLALGLLSQLKKADPVPRSVVAMSPWTDLALASPSMQSRDAADPIWSAAALAEMARLYLGDADPRKRRCMSRGFEVGSAGHVQDGVGVGGLLLQQLDSSCRRHDYQLDLAALSLTLHLVHHRQRPGARADHQATTLPGYPLIDG